MAIDCELLEWTQIDNNTWYEHPRWEVDAITQEGKHIDVKFIAKFWNVSREKTLNLFKQRNIVDEFHFWEWVKRPGRPLEAHDCVEIRQVGVLSYGDVVENLRKSFKEPDGFYVPVRKLL